jgi:hypothetical protein
MPLGRGQPAANMACSFVADWFYMGNCMDGNSQWCTGLTEPAGVREGKLTGGVRRSHRCRTRNSDVTVEAESDEVSQAGSTNWLAMLHHKARQWWTRNGLGRPEICNNNIECRKVHATILRWWRRSVCSTVAWLPAGHGKTYKSKCSDIYIRWPAGPWLGLWRGRMMVAQARYARRRSRERREKSNLVP